MATAAAPAGNVYVGSSWASVQQITPAGTVIGLAGPHACCPDGWGQNVGPGIDSATNIYAATDALIWKITPDGTTTLFTGGNGGFSDGPQASAMFESPQDVFVDALTNLYVSDVSWSENWLYWLGQHNGRQWRLRLPNRSRDRGSI